VICRVETNERGEEPSVRLRLLRSAEVALILEAPIEKVQSLEDLLDGLFVSFLSANEARSVDTVVDRPIDAIAWKVLRRAS
jgi:hypothetical protein